MHQYLYILCRSQWFHPATDKSYTNYTHTIKKTKNYNCKKLKKANTAQRPHTFQRRTHHAYTHYSLWQTTANHTETHTHAQGVLSLMATRNESEKLTSPANTVHPVCMWARQRAVRTADVLLHITNMIYKQRIWVCIPTMRSVQIKNTFEAG